MPSGAPTTDVFMLKTNLDWWCILLNIVKITDMKHQLNMVLFLPLAWLQTTFLPYLPPVETFPHLMTLCSLLSVISA
jgi:hypothetical protein